MKLFFFLFYLRESKIEGKDTKTRLLPKHFCFINLIWELLEHLHFYVTCICLCVIYTYCTCVKVRGQLALVGSLILWCKSWGLNSGLIVRACTCWACVYHLLYKKLRGYRNFDKCYHFFSLKCLYLFASHQYLRLLFITLLTSLDVILLNFTKLIGKRGCCFFLSVVVLMQHPCFLFIFVLFCSFLFFSEGSFSLVYKLSLPSFPSVG